MCTRFWVGGQAWDDGFVCRMEPPLPIFKWLNTPPLPPTHPTHTPLYTGIIAEVWREKTAGEATSIAAPGAPPNEAVAAGLVGDGESRVKRQLFCHVRYYDGVGDLGFGWMDFV